MTIRILKKIIVLLVFFSVAQTQAQGISAGFACSNPVFGLTEWFKPDLEYNVKFIFPERDALSLEYTHYNNENLSGYPKGKLNLSLEHVGIVYLPRFYFSQIWLLQPVVQPGVGIYYWKGIRGDIAANPDLDIPRIDKRILEEWNWGFKLGSGFEIDLTSQIKCDIMLNYRFIVGELWPTLQDYIELEGVSGFQSVNLTVNLIYLFNFE